MRKGLGTATATWAAGQLADRDSPAVDRPSGSTLASTTIANLIRRHYGLAVASCELFQNGINDTYRLHADDRTWWFRLTRRGRHLDGHVAGEVDMLQHLGALGIAVARPVASFEGVLVQTVIAAEGPRDGVLFADATGRPARELSETLGQRLGQGLAALHVAADRTAVARPRLNLDDLLVTSVDAVAPYLATRPAVLAKLRGFADRLYEYLAPLLHEDPRWGFCHGDAHLGNVFFDAQLHPTFIDFDHAVMGYRAYDLAVHLWSLGPPGLHHAQVRPRLRRYWRAVFEGYEPDRDCRIALRRATEALIPTRMFEFFTFMATHPTYFGVGGLEPDRVDSMLAFCMLWARELRLPLGDASELESAAPQPPIGLHRYPLRPADL